jgi:hypothetical protein
MATHTESFTYNDWSITKDRHSDYVEVDSSGTASKFSALFPIRHVIWTISATVTGGYGWVSAYTDEDADEEGASLYAELTVQLYLVTAGGSRTPISGATATGSARRAGYLDCWSQETTDSFRFNTANLTESQKSSYAYLQVGYSCSGNKSHAEVDRYGEFNNGGTHNPSGSCTLTIRDNTNVQHRNSSSASYTSITDLYADNKYMDGLIYDGSRIY